MRVQQGADGQGGAEALALSGPLGRVAGADGEEGGAAPAGESLWHVCLTHVLSSLLAVVRVSRRAFDVYISLYSFAGRKTLESVSAADSLVDALEMAAHEDERQRDHQRQQQSGPALPPNPMMLGLNASAYVLRAVSAASAAHVHCDAMCLSRLDLNFTLLILPFPVCSFCLQLSSVRAADLESALLMLPFTDALRLLGYLPAWLEQVRGLSDCTGLGCLS